MRQFYFTILYLPNGDTGYMVVSACDYNEAADLVIHKLKDDDTVLMIREMTVEENTNLILYLNPLNMFKLDKDQVLDISDDIHETGIDMTNEDGCSFSVSDLTNFGLN